MTVSDVLFQCAGARLYATAAGSEEPDVIVDVGPLVVSGQTGGGARAQVADVFWSLQRENVTCMRINSITFSFSVPEEPGLYLTLVLPPDTPESVLQQLVDVLSGTTAYHPHLVTHERAADATPTAAPPTTATDTASVPQVAPGAPEGTGPAPDKHVELGKQPADSSAAKIHRMGEAAEQWVQGAAVSACSSINQGAEYVKQRVTPAQKPTQMSPRTMSGLRFVQNTAGRVATVTAKVAYGATKMVVGVAASIVTRVVPVGRSGRNTGVGSTVVASVVAVDNVLDALAEAGVQVAHTMASATSEVVKYKYGPQAAEASRMAMGSAVHVVEAQRNLAKLRPTRLAKKTVTTAGKQLVKKAAVHHGDGSGSTPAAAAPAGPDQAGLQQQYPRMTAA